MKTVTLICITDTVYQNYGIN